MEQESELQRLEKFVEKILTRFSALKAEKVQLEQDLFERDMLIEELRDSIASKVTERNEISDRVNKIVDQIEEWEINLDSDDEVVTDDKASEETDLDGEELDSDEQESQESGVEDEKHVQHGLFSMTGSKK
jgi:chromosome segregation ATPase